MQVTEIVSKVVRRFRYIDFRFFPQSKVSTLAGLERVGEGDNF
jgi:hypothetical protein